MKKNENNKMPLWFFLLFMGTAFSINKLLKIIIDHQIYNKTKPYLAWVLSIPVAMFIVFISKKLTQKRQQ